MQKPAYPNLQTRAIQLSTRTIAVFRNTALGIAATGMGWAVVFSAMGWWPIVALDLAIVASGLGTYILIRRGHLSFGLLVPQASLTLIVVIMGLILDVPTAETPRVSHIYLLFLAVLGYVNYQRAPNRAQLALIALNLLAYVILASAPLSLPFALDLPLPVRIVGTWANVIIATSMLAASIYAMQAGLERKDSFGRHIMAALWHREFHLAFQRQVDASGAVIGAEALLRWRSPKHGQVLPSDFIPQAERLGLMVPLGTWVLDEASRTLASWSTSEELRHLTLSINVSVSQLLDDEFESLVRKALSTSGVEPRQLVLELTESVFVSDLDLIAAKLDNLYQLGVTVSLDDFGTGYSSLSYLRKLPIQQLKIDRSFVQDVATTPRSASLVENIIRIGRDLGHCVLAEGVETMEQHEFLVGAGCQQFQGYLYGKPEALGDFERSVFASASASERGVSGGGRAS